MAHQFETCSGCGAPVETSLDGRWIECKYCHSRQGVRVDPVLLATAMHAEFGSIEKSFEVLAGKLAQTLPEHTRVETKRGLLSAPRVESFEIVLGDERFRMRREKKDVVAERVHEVRGIVLKTERMTIDAWLRALSEALSTMAESRTLAHDSLKQMLGS